MSATRIVINALLAAPSVTAVVANRITPAPLPSTSALPALTVYLVSEVEAYTLGGASGYPESRVTVESLSSDEGEADSIGEIVKRALKDYRGAIAGFPEVTIFKEGTDQAAQDEAGALYRRIMDFMVRWREI